MKNIISKNKRSGAYLTIILIVAISSLFVSCKNLIKAGESCSDFNGKYTFNRFNNQSDAAIRFHELKCSSQRDGANYLKSLKDDAQYHRNLVAAAISNNDTNALKFLIEAIKMDVNKTSDEEEGYSLLNAVASDSIDVVKYLIEEHHLDVNTRNPVEKSTPLMMAVQGGHIDIIKYLIEKGADLNATNDGGYNALLSAVLIKSPDAVGTNPPEQDIKDGDLPPGIPKEILDLIKETTKALADITTHPDKPAFAEAGNDLEIVKLLVEHGANINAKNRDNQSVLFLAVMNGRVDIVKYLIEKGVDKEATDNNGVTPLLESCINPSTLKIDESTLKVLVEGGANINAVDKDGNTALVHAARLGYSEFLKYLAANKADVTKTYTASNKTLCELIDAGDKFVFPFGVHDIDIHDDTSPATKNFKYDFKSFINFCGKPDPGNPRGNP